MWVRHTRDWSQEFFLPGDLERLRFIRESGKPPALEPINTAIVYRTLTNTKQEATRCAAAGKRRALLVMVTGKARTTKGLIDVFLRSSSRPENSVPRGS